MARAQKRKVENYTHPEQKRVNNPSCRPGHTEGHSGEIHSNLKGNAMLTRRGVAIGLLSLPSLPLRSFAKPVGSSVAELNTEVPPLLQGRADFGHAWESEAVPEIVAAAPAPDLPKGYAENFAATRFQDPRSIDDYFRHHTGKSFIRWFNDNVARRRYWAGRKITGNHLNRKFHNFWAAYLQSGDISLMEFISYMTVFVNEVGGDFSFKSEQINPDNSNIQHPGICYLFDRFPINAGSQLWYKKSYNLPTNKLCRALFNTEAFNADRQHLPLAEALIGTTDNVWSSQTYPKERFSYSADPRKTGYVLEADFYKFRGRGLIQTTWRGNYSQLVTYVQSYSGTSPIITQFREKWKAYTPDDVCTISTNADWDLLFAGTENIIECTAIRLHAQRGQYLPLSSSSQILNGQDTGSLVTFGDDIGGGGYGNRLKARVFQIATTLGLPTQPTVPNPGRR